MITGMDAGPHRTAHYHTLVVKCVGSLAKTAEQLLVQAAIGGIGFQGQVRVADLIIGEFYKRAR
jgi:hypothetical protein